jgi:chromosome segregation ATPase
MENVFTEESRLQAELQAAQKQLAEIAAKIVATDADYRRAAVDAVNGGSDDGAIKLRRALEKLGVRKDGLDACILDLESKHQEVARLAQARRVELTENARRERLAAAVAEGQAAARGVVDGFEILMLAISRFDDARAALAAPDFAPLNGLAEVEKLGNLMPHVGPGSLRGRLLAAGWKERTGVRPTFLEVTGLQAPPEK